MNRGTYRYQASKPMVDDAYEEVVALSDQYPYWGYRKIFDLMDTDVWQIGRERVRIIRRREGLQVIRKARKKKLLGMSTQWVNKAEYPGHVWSYDFVHDQTEDGRTLKSLTVIDEFTRAGLTIRIGRSLTSGDVIQTLQALFKKHGRPVCIRSDNGPEFISSALQQWLKQNKIDTHYIDPGSPWQNGHNESFNSIYRTTCLNRCLFQSLTEARVVVEKWLEEYNSIRPHGSLKGLAPNEFVRQWKNKELNQQPKSLTLEVVQRSWA